MKNLFFFSLLACLLLCPMQNMYCKSIDSAVNVQLKGVPFADDAKIVRNVFSITIPGYPGAYNPSIVTFKGSFLLSFRYDDDRRGKSLVGLVRLDNHFKAVGTPVIADQTYEQQDVRLFWYGKKLFSTGSRIITMNPPQCPIALSEINTKNLLFNRVVDLDFHPQIIEKNWVPIVHTNSVNKKDLYYVYSHNPRHILRVSSTSQGTIEQIFCADNKIEAEWEKKWGKIRGGTPCTVIDNQQLAFFHSAFFDGTRWWWVTGAITFEDKIPFRITKISPFPIVARGMYTTPYAPRFRMRTFKVAFPGGFVEVQKKKKSLIYLVYGENDSGIKVLVLDKKRLLASLKDFPSKT